ncbi:MAG: NUDIX domain-containing protein [Alphaproteobacteria bacterium]
MAVLKPRFDARDVEIAGRGEAYSGYGSVLVYKVRHRLFEGGWSPVVRREVYDSGDAVVVLPYDPRRDEIVLVEQFRAPPLHRNGPPWVFECVAGRIDKNATPEQIAHSEAREEAGCTLTALEPVGGMYASPGIFAEYVHCFCGRTDTSAVNGIHGVGSEHENIRVHVVAFDEAMRALGDGRIRAATVFATLQWLALNRERLRREWS